MKSSFEVHHCADLRMSKIQKKRRLSCCTLEKKSWNAICLNKNVYHIASSGKTKEGAKKFLELSIHNSTRNEDITELHEILDASTAPAYRRDHDNTSIENIIKRHIMDQI